MFCCQLIPSGKIQLGLCWGRFCFARAKVGQLLPPSLPVAPLFQWVTLLESGVPAASLLDLLQHHFRAANGAN